MIVVMTGVPVIFAQLTAQVLAQSAPTVITNEVVSDSDQSQKVDTLPTTPEQIATWIAELDDNRYLVREQASRQLLEAGGAALDPLTATANGQKPEPADRAVWVLQRLGDSTDRDLRRQALERLVQIQKSPKVQAAARRALAELRNDEAIDALREQGAQFITSPTADNSRQNLVIAVILDPQWRGGDAGLRHLRDLIGLQQVCIIGTEITAEGLAELQNVNFLQSLLVYNTRLDRSQVTELQKLLPRATIDWRKGGLLGVRADASGGNVSAVVGFVQKGSAAEAAGIRVGDVIAKFEGEAVTNFTDLTSKISEHPPGDEVSMEIQREGMPVHVRAKLGQWTADNLPMRMTPQ